jgi:hypothetical protein
MCELCGVSMQGSAIQSYIQGKKHLGRFKRSDGSATATLPPTATTTRTSTDTMLSCQMIIIPTTIKCYHLICLLLEFLTINNCKISKVRHGQHVARAVY